MPALTVSQTRQIFTQLLRNPPPTPRQITAAVNAVLTRTEEARIYHWHKATGNYPPRRTRGP